MLATQIRRLLQKDPLAGKAAIAQKVGLQLRVLTRALTGEGTTFRDISDEVLFRLACKRLANPALSIWDVAMATGFSEWSAFNRAFRRWSGGWTPTRWRRVKHGIRTPTHPRSRH